MKASIKSQFVLHDSSKALRNRRLQQLINIRSHSGGKVWKLSCYLRPWTGISKYGGKGFKNFNPYPQEWTCQIGFFLDSSRLEALLNRGTSVCYESSCIMYGSRALLWHTLHEDQHFKRAIPLDLLLFKSPENSFCMLAWGVQHSSSGFGCSSWQNWHTQAKTLSIS